MTVCPTCSAQVPDGAIYCDVCGSKITTRGSKPEISETDMPYESGQNVKRCAFCSKPLTGEDAYYFNCRYCGQIFCNDHRLPENHLCRSAPSRRNVPTGSSSGGYWSTSYGGYSTSSIGRRGGSSWFNISKPGRNLAILIVLGLVLGFVFSLVSLGQGVTLTELFVQYNYAVFNGAIWQLVTSAIIVYPDSGGILDVFFNAISVIWLDGLLRSAYSPRQYYIVFISTAVAGNLLTLLYGPNLISFGASGGIFGLLAGAVTVDYVRNRRLNKGLLMWFVFIFIYSSFAGGVNLFAHLGGALFGLVAGYIVGRSGISRRKDYRRQ